MPTIERIADVEHLVGQEVFVSDWTEVTQARIDNTRRLHRAGVTILAGSDPQAGVFPGPGLHAELAALAESGLAPIEVLRATTLYAARFLEQTRDPSFGVVSPGKQAYLVLIEGNPLKEVGALSRIKMVVRRGVVLERVSIGN